MSKVPDQAELAQANAIWGKLVAKSKEIAIARMNNKPADVDAILTQAGVKAADMAYYKSVIMKCPVTNPW